MTSTRDGQWSPLMDELIDAYRTGTAKHYADVRDRFIREHGAISDAYFAKRMAAGVVIVKPPGTWNRLMKTRKIKIRHDGVKAALVQPDFEAALWRVRRIERESGLTLSGHSRKVLLEMLFSVTVYLLSVLDSLSPDPKAASAQPQEDAKSRSKRIRVALECADKEMTRLEEFLARTSENLALKFYLLGLPLGAVTGGLLVWAVNTYRIADEESSQMLAVALGCGAIGAIISVMVRVTRQGRAVDAVQGHLMTWLAGGFRPLIGAVFGAALYVFVMGGLIPLEIPEGQQEWFLFASLAFLAGFNERWAQDTIVRSAPTLPGTTQRSGSPGTGKGPMGASG
ncbi:MAG TPA: hypothetical protein VFZ64_01275 [Nocardioidaceae bacterium]